MISIHYFVLICIVSQQEVRVPNYEKQQIYYFLGNGRSERVGRNLLVANLLDILGLYVVCCRRLLFCLFIHTA